MLRSNVKAEAGALKSYAKTGVVVQRLAPAFVPQGVRVKALASTSRGRQHLLHARRRSKRTILRLLPLAYEAISAAPLAQNAMFRVPCRGDEKNRGLTGNSP